MYDELTEGLEEAFDNDLSDTTENVSFIKNTTVYNEDTMINVPTPVTTIIRAMVIYNTEKGQMDDISTKEYVGFLVLDTDRGSYEFETDQIAKIGTQQVKIVTIKPDPAGATYRISARKIG